MIGFLPLAFAAGILTATTPCIVPVLPGILGGSIGRNKWRPAAIVAGLVASFTVFGTAFAIVLDFLGLSKETVRIISIAILFILGIALAMPALWEWIVIKWTLFGRRSAALHVPLSGRQAPALQRGEGEGNRESFWSAFGIGASLCAVWTPCAGPILGIILTFAANSNDIFRSGILVFIYALGAGVPMLFIGYGTRALVTRIKALARHSTRVRQVAGLMLIAWSVALLFNTDQTVQAFLTRFVPVPKL